MKIEKVHYFLLLIYISSVILRLFYAVPHNFTHEAYFHINQIINLQSNWVPNFSNEVYMPLFHYVLAIFSLIQFEFMLKLIPNFIASLIIFPAYLISYEISGSRKASIVSAILTTFMPIYLISTINTLSPLALFMPLLGYTLYYFIKLKNSKYVSYFVVSIILLLLSNSAAIILVPVLLTYLILSRVDKLPIQRFELETIIFSLLFLIWAILLLYRNPLILQGLLLIWQNNPTAILSERFANFDVIFAIYSIGIIPFFAGLFVIYEYVLRAKDRGIYFLTSFVIVLLLFLWLRMLELNMGLIFLGLGLILLSSKSYSLIFKYISTTKFAKYRNHLIIVLIVLVSTTSLIPAYFGVVNSQKLEPTQNELDVFNWISNNTDQDSIVLSSYKEGYLVTAVSQRQNVIDSDFLLVQDSDRLYEDVYTIYTTTSSTEAVRLLDYYSVDYIVVTNYARDYFGITDLAYVGDRKCYSLVYSKGRDAVYESLCRI